MLFFLLRLGGLVDNYNARAIKTRVKQGIKTMTYQIALLLKTIETANSERVISSQVSKLQFEALALKNRIAVYNKKSAAFARRLKQDAKRNAEMVAQWKIK